MTHFFGFFWTRTRTPSDPSPGPWIGPGYPGLRPGAGRTSVHTSYRRHNMYITESTNGMKVLFFYEKCHHWKIISSETETQLCNHGHTSTWISFELYCTVLQSSKQIQNTLFKIVIQRKHHFPQPFLLFRRPTSKNGLKKGHFRPFLLAALRKKCCKEWDTSWSNEQVL